VDRERFEELYMRLGIRELGLDAAAGRFCSGVAAARGPIYAASAITASLSGVVGLQK
jgi:hypothetical protein